MGKVTQIYRPTIGRDGLSALQRDTMKQVLALEAAGVPVNVRSFSAATRTSYASAQNRLATLAAKGRLRVVQEGVAGVRQQVYASAQVRDVGAASPRVVWRMGQKITVCPPAHAFGALSWGSVLGRSKGPSVSG